MARVLTSFFPSPGASGLAMTISLDADHVADSANMLHSVWPADTLVDRLLSVIERFQDIPGVHGGTYWYVQSFSL